MIRIKFTQASLRKINQVFMNPKQKLDTAMYKALNKIGDKAQYDARRFAPVKKGHLRRSITKRVNSKFVLIGTDLKYSAIHEFGGTITPKNAKQLAFKVNGKWVFTKRVVIKKYKGRGYFAPAFAEAKKFAKRVFKQEIEMQFK